MALISAEQQQRLTVLFRVFPPNFVNFIKNPIPRDEIVDLNERLNIAELFITHGPDVFGSFLHRHPFATYRYLAIELRDTRVPVGIPSFVKLNLSLDDLTHIYNHDWRGSLDKSDLDLEGEYCDSTRGDCEERPHTTVYTLNKDLLEYYCEERRHVHDFLAYFPPIFIERCYTYQLCLLRTIGCLLPREIYVLILNDLYLDIKEEIVSKIRLRRLREERFDDCMPELQCCDLSCLSEPAASTKAWKCNFDIKRSLDELISDYEIYEEEDYPGDSLPDPAKTRQELDEELDMLTAGWCI